MSGNAKVHRLLARHGVDLSSPASVARWFNLRAGWEKWTEREAALVLEALRAVTRSKARSESGINH